MRQDYRHLLMALALWFGLLVGTKPLMASEISFQEHATEVIYASLKAQKGEGFLQEFYKRLLFLPAWVHEHGLSNPAVSLFSMIDEDATLPAGSSLRYKASVLQEEADKLYLDKSTFLQKMEMEFKITLLYEEYIHYTYFGGINWGAFKARIANLIVNDVTTDWELYRPEVDPAGMVEAALMGADLKELMHKAEPKAYHYQALKKKLAAYLRLEANGGWDRVVLEHQKLTPGMSDIGVPDLRQRLTMSGEYTGCEQGDAGEHYDPCLVAAVKRFQAHHGLSADGVVGPATLRQLNVPIAKRITTIRLNLDRIKWLNQQEPPRHIMINIPFFTLYVEENGKLIKKMRVITGKPNHPTPIFSDEVETIVLNPYWNIPTSIIQKEMIPKLLKDPYALKKKGIEIFNGWGKHAEVVDPATVDWTQYLYSKRVPYRFAQLPGKRNALGKIKFLFPNKFSVYMHDTPTKPLFNRTKRAFSHGCIRLHKPVELLQTFSAFEPDIDFAKAKEVLKGKENSYMKLHEKIPVDIVYLTAWVDYKGALQFRDDVYHYDKMQLQSYKQW